MGGGSLVHETLWKEETGMSGYADSSGFWSAHLSVACCGQWMMCDWSDRKRSMHSGAARKGFVTSVVRSPPVRRYTGGTLVHEYIENIILCLLIYLFIYNSRNVSMFAIINYGNVRLARQTRSRMRNVMEHIHIASCLMYSCRVLMSLPELCLPAFPLLALPHNQTSPQTSLRTPSLSQTCCWGKAGHTLASTVEK